MDDRERRLAENEIFFRSINERIDDVAAHMGVDGHRYEFVCECADRGCTARIELTLADYDAVRRHPAHFVVTPGHEQLDIETVVDRRRQFFVVEKQGEAAELAARRHERRESG